MNTLEEYQEEKAKLENSIAVLTRDIGTLENMPPTEDYFDYTDRQQALEVKRVYLAYARARLASVNRGIALYEKIDAAFRSIQVKLEEGQ